MCTRVVFFDIGTTLITGPTRTPAQLLAQTLGWNNTTRCQLERHLLTSEIDSPSALIALLTSTYGVSETIVVDLVAMIWQSQREIPQPVPGGIKLLSALRSRKIQYGFISNIWPPYATTFTRLYGSLAQTDLTFFSFRLGITKPDLSLFQKAVNATGRTPQACTMVGDSYGSDMQPSMTLGMKTVWFLCRPEKEGVVLEKISRNILPAPDKIVSSLVGLDVATIVDPREGNRCKSYAGKFSPREKHSHACVRSVSKGTDHH